MSFTESLISLLLENIYLLDCAKQDIKSSHFHVISEISKWPASLVCYSEIWVCVVFYLFIFNIDQDIFL